MCAAKGGMCNWTGVRPSPSAKRDFVLDCMRRAAEQSIRGYDPAVHGLGLARYDSGVVQTVAS
jgi:hypothetical protein